MALSLHGTLAKSSGFRLALTLAALAPALLALGCASPGQPVAQAVRVETPGCDRVTCELRNDLGRWPIARTPATVTLISSPAPLQVACRADDGSQGNSGAASSTTPITGAGAVAGGVVGGGAVGAALGATALAFIPPLGVIAVVGGGAGGAAAGQAVESRQRALRYPDLIIVPMSCQALGEPVLPAGAPWGLVVRGLLPADAHSAAGDSNTSGAVHVVSADPVGRAAAVGLRAGDTIAGVDGKTLQGAADLEERLRRFPPGAPLVLRVRRDGLVLDLVLTQVAAAA